MKTTVVKRSVVIGGHKTSVSLEDAFWADLKKIASRRSEPLSQLIARIDDQRTTSNLSSALRLFVLDDYLQQITELQELKHPSDVPIAPIV